MGLMVVVLVYVFGIVIHMFLKDDDLVANYFETLSLCMWTLLMDGTLLDAPGVVLNRLVRRGEFNTTVAVIFFLVFILLSALTVMNMLIGILCNVVTAVAASEKEEADIAELKKTILLELKKFDDGDGMIVAEELAQLMAAEESVQVLESLGIDVSYLQQMQAL